MVHFTFPRNSGTPLDALAAQRRIATLERELANLRAEVEFFTPTRAAEKRIATLTSQLAAQQAQTEAATMALSAAIERVENAENWARDAEERMKEAEERAEEAEYLAKTGKRKPSRATPPLKQDFEYGLKLISWLMFVVAAFAIIYQASLIPVTWDEYVIFILVLANKNPVKILRNRDREIEGDTFHGMNDEPKLTRMIYGMAEWLQEIVIAFANIKYVKHVVPMTFDELFNSVCIWLCFSVVLYILDFNKIIFVLLQILYVRLLSQMRVPNVYNEVMTNRPVKFKSTIELSPFN